MSGRNLESTQKKAFRSTVKLCRQWWVFSKSQKVHCYTHEKVTWHPACLSDALTAPVVRDEWTSTCVCTSMHLNPSLNNYRLQERVFRLDSVSPLWSHPAVMPTHWASLPLCLTYTHTHTHIHRWARLLRMWWQTARGLLWGRVSAEGSEESERVCQIREKRRVSCDNKQRSLKGSVELVNNV